jgi:hypothetical protein
MLLQKTSNPLLLPIIQFSPFSIIVISIKAFYRHSLDFLGVHINLISICIDAWIVEGGRKAGDISGII